MQRLLVLAKIFSDNDSSRIILLSCTYQLLSTSYYNNNPDHGTKCGTQRLSQHTFFAWKQRSVFFLNPIPRNGNSFFTQRFSGFIFSPISWLKSESLNWWFLSNLYIGYLLSARFFQENVIFHALLFYQRVAIKSVFSMNLVIIYNFNQTLYRYPFFPSAQNSRLQF